MKTVKHKTNDEVINDLMIYGNPMKQLMILEAVQVFVERIVKLGREDLRALMSANEIGFINPDAWFNCAVEIKEALDAHLSNP